jgi:hypothetical protein
MLCYLFVIIILLWGFELHCRNNSLENPHSMSGVLANTTYGEKKTAMAILTQQQKDLKSRGLKKLLIFCIKILIYRVIRQLSHSTNFLRCNTSCETYEDVINVVNHYQAINKTRQDTKH